MNHEETPDNSLHAGLHAGEQHYAKYGGVSFTNNVPAEKINEFVNALPEDRKTCLFTVMKELNKAGLISINEGDHSTIDKDLENMQEPNAYR